MNSHGLPQTLLDLTYAWTRSHRPILRSTLAAGSRWRSMQTQALLKNPESYSHVYGGRDDFSIGERKRTSTKIGRLAKPRSTAIGMLKERVDALLAQPIEEFGSLEAPLYSEEDLQEIYADLLAHPAVISPEAQASEQEKFDVTQCPALLQNALSRLGLGVSENPFETHKSAVLSDTLVKLRQGDDPGPSQIREIPVQGDETAQYTKLLGWLQQTVANLEKANSVTQDVVKTDAKGLPVKLLSTDEWKALTYACIEGEDFDACERTLDLARRCNDNAFEDLVNFAIATYAVNGEVMATENLIGKYSNGKPTKFHCDMHVKAHLRAPCKNADNPTEDIIQNTTRALSTLHSYEAISVFPEQRTYTRIINVLFHAQSAQCHAQAWDLFAHMRYVAHPEPDEILYTTMIRSCASSGPSQSHTATEPERALDLWKELTADGRVPGLKAYNAIILVCARSKTYASEAFRLVKEMLDAHRDAFGNPMLRPSSFTLCALLEAAKKTGDLARARWILAEVVNSFKHETNEITEKEAGLYEEAISHVFHAYSSYRPPFRRQATEIVTDEQVHSLEQEKPALGQEQNETQALEQTHHKRFTAIPPQTHTEILAEVDLLYDRILLANGRLQPIYDNHSEELSSSVFSHAKLTSRLVNSYLDVHYSHDSLSNAYTLFRKVFTEADVERNVYTYLHALQRISNYRSTDEREVALRFANEVWNEWQVFERGLPKYGKSARMIERVYAAMIKVNAIYNDISRAVSILRDFFNMYNPRSVRDPTPRSPLRSARTKLYAHKPIIRLISPTEIPDDRVPPLLTFTDVRALHQRLVLEGRTKDIKFVKYVCVSYECQLKKRRELSLKAEDT